MLTKMLFQIYYIVYKKYLFKKEKYFLSVNLSYDYKEDRLWENGWIIMLMG